MSSIVQEWAYLPQMFLKIITTPGIWAMLLIGNMLGYVIGILPGLGPTMGMALTLGIIFRMDPTMGLALLIGIMVASMSSGGITACLANIPGTASAAATCVDGYPLTKKGKGNEAVVYSFLSSIMGTMGSMLIVFLVQPFIAFVALKFGDWEVFLFCLFGVVLCGSLVGGNPIRGWIAAFVGVFISMCGVEEVQSVMRYTLGIPYLFSGVNNVVAFLGLFGLGEVFIVLLNKTKAHVEQSKGGLKFNWPVLKANVVNYFRSLLVGLWVGFIPGIGESAACWLSYDVAHRGSKNKEEFGKGNPEGIIAAETANNAATVGALIPSMALGIPGSATTGIFIAALFLIGYRPGPTMLKDSPGILCTIALLFIISGVITLLICLLASRFTIKFLTMDDNILMPLIVLLCAVGAYGTMNNKFSLLILLVFGIIGMFMKLFGYPMPPMILGMLIGSQMDKAFRRAIIQYSGNYVAMVTRPIGIGILVFLIVMVVISVRSTRRTQTVSSASVEQFEQKYSEEVSMEK